MRFRSREGIIMEHADHTCECYGLVIKVSIGTEESEFQVVDKESAIIDGSHKIGLETDHRNIQRFHNKEDEDYKSILYWIRKWLGEVTKAADGKCR